ncbi:MAG: hypothetical protein QG657_351 [Acidobacteriota bacterium]|nr:hypothetical protein [Acidobacteriota bacterium]
MIYNVTLRVTIAIYSKVLKKNSQIIVNQKNKRRKYA